MKKVFISFIVILFIINTGFAQDKKNCGWTEIEDAKKKFETGVFYEAIDLLDKCLSDFDEQKQIEALSLLSKIHFEIQDDSLAMYYASQLLEVNPRYQPTYSSDPMKFINVVSEIKAMTSKNTVTSISKKAENVDETPATAIIISEEILARRGYLDLEAVIHDLPGFDISRSNGNLYSHIYQRGYRSINTNRTLFLTDGIEENDLWSSNVYLSRQYPISNIQNIEVVYGPASTMYGSNAFLGVINIITKKPKDFLKKGHNIGINSRVGYGSYNTRFFDGSIAARTKNSNIAFSLTGRVFLSDEQDLSGYPEHDFAPYTYDSDGEHFRSVLSITDPNAVQEFLIEHPEQSDLYTVNDEQTEIIPTTKGINQAIAADNTVYNNVEFKDYTEAYIIDAKMQLYDLLIGWNSWTKAEGTGSQYNDFIFLTAGEGGTWRPSHNYFYAKYDKNVNSKLNITNFVRFKTHTFNSKNNVTLLPARYYLGNYGLAQLLGGVEPQPISLHLFQNSNQLREELKMVYRPQKWFDLVAGFETRFSSIQGDYFSLLTDSAEELGAARTDIKGGNQFFSRDIGVYAQSGFNFVKDLNITLGIRYDNNKVRETQGYGNSINPRAAVVYTTGSIFLKAIYAEAFKDATNKEKYSTAEDKRELSNPFLEPEKVKNYEFVAGKKFFDNSLKISSSFYYAHYSNIIQEVRVLTSDGSYTNQNQAVGQAEVYGINAFADYKINKFTAYMNYTYTQPFTLNPIDSEGNPQTDSLGNIYEKLRISDIADHQINFGVNYLFFQSLNVNLRANYCSEKITGYNTTVVSNSETFEPYIIFNGAVKYISKETGLSLQFTIFNILNKEYFSPGLDYATGDLASKLVQNRRNMYISLIYQY